MRQTHIVKIFFGILILVLWIEGFLDAVKAASARKTYLERSCSKRQNCNNGVCDYNTNKCQCLPGWMGIDCSVCGGKISLTSSKGWLADAVGNYSANSKCTWLIEAPPHAHSIRLHIKEFATECGWDHLYIFDGDSVFSDLKAVYSGLIQQNRYSIQDIPEVVGTSGHMLLHFYSDVAYNMTGFNITFSINACPSQKHDLTCSGHGSCDGNLGRCRCDEDFRGAACSQPVCPNNCAPLGIRRGTCNIEAKKCDCYTGWEGTSCAQETKKGYWTILEPFNSTTHKRTSHAAVYDPERSIMWVVGGEMFSPLLSEKLQTGSLVTTLHLKANGVSVWKDVSSRGRTQPSPRYGHSMVIHDGKIYIYGGTMRSGHTSHELWSFDMTSLIWERVKTAEGRCLSGHDKLCGPINSMGHTATIVVNRMVVIFGHSPKYGYLNIVQEYHFGNKEWSIVDTSGYTVMGGFGHSAVLDDVTKKIYVYGGYISTSSVRAELSDQLLAYDPIINRWILLRRAMSFRYMHTSIISRGMMLVFGGNTHNDTVSSNGAKCYTADFLAYDIDCDVWHDLRHDVVLDTLPVDLARLGHSAVRLSNDSMLIYGGFHGVLKNDLVSFVPGECHWIKNREACLTQRLGVKCFWNKAKQSCQIRSKGLQKSDNSEQEVEKCIAIQPDDSISAEFCRSHTRSCSTCVSTSLGCVWCPLSNTCEYKNCDRRDGEKHIVQSNDCFRKMAPIQEVCQKVHTCSLCSAIKGCKWNIDKISKCVRAVDRDVGQANDPFAVIIDERNKGSFPCHPTCSQRKSCMNCTFGSCMWCKNLGTCVDRNAYVISFPYGQCMDWTTKADDCPSQSVNSSTGLNRLKPDSTDICQGYFNCDECRNNPACGWCDDDSKTGVGVCLPGGASGPLLRYRLRLGHYVWRPNNNVCPVTTNWHFTSCPACQCNGHSECDIVGEKFVCHKCRDNTTGNFCEKCSYGFYGNPINGNNCSVCECNGQGESCHHETGICQCNTKGTTGDRCEKCDTKNHYVGNPINGSCFYDLAVDYQFTFNLSKVEDKHLTAINFKNTPTKPDVDVDFQISCSVPAKLNLTFKYVPLGSNQMREEIVLSRYNCSAIKNRFSKSDFLFNSSANASFYVYIYEISPPLLIVVSFSQHPKLDLLQFFVTFLTCFLALLLLAAMMWKIKSKYSRYRRRQRLFVEMEQMASRPFGAVVVEINPLTIHHTNKDICSSPTNSDKRKRKKKNYASPIALEPCLGKRAAVLSLIVRLPTGGRTFPDSGCSGIAIASSLVMLGNPNLKSNVSDTGHGRASVIDDDPKTNRKVGRKTNSAQPSVVVEI